MQEASVLDDNPGDDHIGSISSDIAERISGGAVDTDRAVGGIDVRLDGELLTRFEFVFPHSADFEDFSCELVSDDHRILGEVLRKPLVDTDLMGGLVGRHADAVTDYLGQDLILLEGRKFELLKAEILIGIKAYCFRLHIASRLNRQTPFLARITCWAAVKLPVGT